MALLKGSEPAFMTAEGAAQRRGYAAESELALRNAMETLLRSWMPEARMCHEMVMGEGKVRADLVAVGPAHIAAVEVKGEYDDTTRLLHQVGMYQLCVPEVWIVVPEKHERDAKLIAYLIPSVGLITGTGIAGRHGKAQDPVTLRVEKPPKKFKPDTDAMLCMLWAQELRNACGRLKVSVTSKTARGPMIKEMLRVCRPPELLKEVCTELRSRDALWRADPPVKR